MGYELPLEPTGSQYDSVLLVLVAAVLVSGILLLFAIVMPEMTGIIISGEEILVLGLTFVTAVILLMSIQPTEEQSRRDFE